ncbi:hypothetical protein GPECTOR_85g345 [Gonium pectorale]|uniref:PAS domain-containing protein n=1 Tax=Gonium pectorale TaxID=33097 RepID=A0A150G284_GONPE|nr:hypothetical protein GPECTOR_85g345 [Gonium pectorale]|eukprot:KXZ43615.1 hypothetical protein GPECTOR_85g345 [Gonium pectorale]
MSGASVSSFGSSANGGSSVGTQARTGPTFDDGDIFEEPQTLQLGIFGDFLQLWLLVVNPSYGWAISAKNKVWQVVSFIQLNAFLSARGYSFFLALLYVFIGLLGVNLALSIWVANAFSNNRFEHVWPIQFLRWFGLIFYQVLDIATLTLLLVTLDCNYFNVPVATQFHNQEFPDVMCWSMPHIIHVAVSVVSIVVFGAMAMCQVVSEMELNPLTRNYMGICHTHVEGMGFVIKVIVTIASVTLGTSTKWLAVVYLFFFAMLFYLSVRWVPYIYSALNYVRCASYAMVLYSSALLMVLAYGPSGSMDRQSAFRERVTWAMWGGMGPAAAMGALACHLRLRHFAINVQAKFRHAEPGNGPKTLYRFTDAREVEISARCCRRWVDEDTLEPEAVELSEAIIKAGMLQLPQDPQMIILYSSFLIDVQGSYQSGYTQLQTAKKQAPGILERFAIFSREQAHTQKASGANNGAPDSAVDLVSYVEFQRNHRLVVRAHREALLAMRSFWGLLLRHHVSFNHLSKALHRIEVSVKGAERAYRGVLSRHGSSPRIVRLYGRFLETVKFDPWAASKWYTEADRLEEEAELTREAMQLGGMETLLPQAVTADRGPDMDGVAFICINAKGIIQVASPEAHTLLGYMKNELKGRDVGIIMPPPFGERHSAYVRNYIQTGTSALLDRTSDMVCLTKNLKVLRIRLRISKVSGLNEDSVFLGVIEPVPPTPNEARAWVLGNGTLVAADDRFCDWLGYEGTELPGVQLEELLLEKNAVKAVIKGFSKAAHAAAFSINQTHRLGHRRPSNAGNEMALNDKPDKSLAAASLMGGIGGGEKASITGAGDANKGLSWLRRTVTNHGLNSSGTGMTSGVAAPAPHAPVLLPRAAWHHKYSAPLGFDTCLQPGVFGSVKVHTVILRRCHSTNSGPGADNASAGALVPRGKAGAFGPHPVRGHEVVPPTPRIRYSYDDMMLVADLKGRILHMTSSLAEALGGDAEAIRAGGLSMLIPEPASILHGPWMQELGTPQSTALGPAAAAPAYSCRRGVAVCLNTRGDEHGNGPGLKPFRLTVQQRMADGGGSKVHVVSLVPLTMEQALAERCLSLTADLTGTILEADDRTPAELFGADPRSLAGRSLAQLVDLFRPDWDPDGATPESGFNGSGGATTPQQATAAARRLTRTLLELARRDSENPGCSWRVGVQVPPTEAARRQLDRIAALLGPEDASLAARFNGAKTVPAVMRVRLVQAPPSQPQASAPNRSGGSSMTHGSPGGVQWQAPSFAPRAISVKQRGAFFDPGPIAEGAEEGEEATPVEPFQPHVRRSPVLSNSPDRPRQHGPGPLAEATETGHSTESSGKVLLNPEDVAALEELADAIVAPSPPRPPHAGASPSGAPAAADVAELTAELADLSKLPLQQPPASRLASRRPSNSALPSHTVLTPPPVASVAPIGADLPSTPRSNVPTARTPPPQHLTLPLADSPKPGDHGAKAMGGSGGTPQPPEPPRESGAISRPQRASGLGMYKEHPVSLRLPPDMANLVAAAAMAMEPPYDNESDEAKDEAGNEGALVLEIELWRADLLSGVLEVDERGRVLRADQSPLDSSDLVLGAPASALAGAAVSSLIPLPPGGVSSLLEGDPNMPVAVRGALKKRVVKQPKAGAPVVMSTRHHSDGCGLAVVVQAVRRAGPSGSAFLLLHPSVPSAVQPGFVRWVYDNDMTSLMTPLGVGPPVGVAGHARLTALGMASAALLRGDGPVLPGGDSSRLKASRTTMRDVIRAVVAAQANGGAAPTAAGTVSGSGAATVYTATAAGIITPHGGGGGERTSTTGLTPPGDARGRSGSGHPPRDSNQPSSSGDAPAAAGGHGSRGVRPRLSFKASFTPPGPQEGSEDVEAATPPTHHANAKICKSDSTDMDTIQDTAFEMQGIKAGGKAPTWKAGGGPSFNSFDHQGSSDVAKGSPRQSAELMRPVPEDGPSSKVRPTSRLSAKKHSMVHSWVLSNSPARDGESRSASIPNRVPDDMDGDADQSEQDSEGRSGGVGASSNGGSTGSDNSGDRPDGAVADRVRPASAGGSESRESSTDGDIENEAGQVVANYQVGKRFKKLHKILTSPLAQQPARKLRWRALSAVGAILIVHTATFVSLLVQLLQQETAVKDLNSAAMAAINVHEIATAGRVLDQLYAGNSFVSGLPQFGDPVNYALNETYNELADLMQSMKDLHRGVYVGFGQRRRIASDYGLRDLWEKAWMNITLFYDANDPADTSRILPGVEPPAPSTIQLGLWDAGNLYVTMALQMHNRGPVVVAEGANFTNWSVWRFIQASEITNIFSS